MDQSCPVVHKLGFRQLNCFVIIVSWTRRVSVAKELSNKMFMSAENVVDEHPIIKALSNEIDPNQEFI
jgi:hypothetical protein